MKDSAARINSGPPKNHNTTRSRYDDALNIDFGGARSHETEHIGAPIDRVLDRVKIKQARSRIATMLQHAQMNADDDQAVIMCFKQANWSRQQVGESWAQIITRCAT